MIIVYYKKKSYTMADCFEELSDKQFISISEILFTGGDELQCYSKALRILLKMSRFRFRLLDAELIDRCMPFIEWVFKDTRVTQQLISKYKGHYGPISDFDNLKMKEFHFSEQYYNEVRSQEFGVGSQESLDKLIAILYRTCKLTYDKKLNIDGDVRVAFNPNEVEYNARRIKKWPDAVKHAIFFWYHSCRQDLIDNNPLVFKEPGDGFESQFDTGLYGVLRSLAGDKLGTIAQIEEMYVHTAMLELGLLKEEEQRIEEQSKKNNA